MLKFTSGFEKHLLCLKTVFSIQDLINGYELRTISCRSNKSWKLNSHNLKLICNKYNFYYRNAWRRNV